MPRHGRSAFQSCGATPDFVRGTLTQEPACRDQAERATASQQHFLPFGQTVLLLSPALAPAPSAFDFLPENRPGRNPFLGGLLYVPEGNPPVAGLPALLTARFDTLTPVTNRGDYTDRFYFG